MVTSWKTSDRVLDWISGLKASPESNKPSTSTNWADWLGEVSRDDESEQNDSEALSRFQESKLLTRDSRSHRLMWFTVAPASAMVVKHVSGLLSSQAVSAAVPALATVFAATTTQSTPLGYVEQLGSSLLMMMYNTYNT